MGSTHKERWLAPIEHTDLITRVGDLPQVAVRGQGTGKNIGELEIMGYVTRDRHTREAGCFR